LPINWDPNSLVNITKLIHIDPNTALKGTYTRNYSNQIMPVQRGSIVACKAVEYINMEVDEP